MAKAATKAAKAKEAVAPAETPAPAEAAAPAPAPVPKDTKNGVTRPKAGTKTGRIWAITDAISAKERKPAPRKDVIAQASAEGINEATAATQYGRWRKYHGLKNEPKAAPVAAEAAAPVAAAAAADVTVE